jgi:hypothetical protein
MALTMFEKIREFEARPPGGHALARAGTADQLTRKGDRLTRQAPQSARPIRMRRLWRPLLSIFKMRSGRERAVEARCVPPHA